MILFRLLKKDFYIQKTEELLENILYLLSNNGLIFYDEYINLDNKNNQEALYNFSNNKINIPDSFYRLDKNHKQFEAIQKYLGDKTLEFIIKHEFGHLNHHQFLSLALNINNTSNIFSYKDLNSNSNYIKTNTSLEKLFDRTLSKSNPIEDFIHMNFMEAYADSYAGLTSYLQDKDKSIFSKIHNLRLAQFKELKASDNLTIKQNPNDNSIAEVYSGLFSTSRYSNYLSSQYIKENIVEQFSFEILSNMSIHNLHNLIQIEVISSLQEILKKEINNNPLFNKQFNDYLQTKHISIQDYFNQFNKGILEYKEDIYIKIIHNELLNQYKPELDRLINFHANNNLFESSHILNKFFNEEEEKDIQPVIIKLKNENKLDKNKEGISKYIVDSYVLPNNDYKLLIKLLLTNNIECEKNKTFKLKEIIKNLKDETKDYLYNSYKGNPKIKIESIPKLNNKSNVELLEQFKNSLNNKSKKRYNDLEAKYSLTEISTPYLSSSFNAGVLNNEAEITPVRANNEITHSINNIRHKFTQSISTIKNNNTI